LIESRPEMIGRAFIRRLLPGLLLAALSLTVAADTWRFALIGDTPYNSHERTELPKMLSAIADSKVDVIVHVGDFKSGTSHCSDEVFEDRFRLFNASTAPFVLVPGDNEWTDCERLSNGAHDPLERLAKLRSLFWNKDQSLGQATLPLERQAGAYPEHARFRLGPVLFATFNLPGGNNNWGMSDTPRTEFLARNPVTVAWLKESFALAQRDGVRGIVLALQANPGFKHHAQGLAHRAYREFLDTLLEETQRFQGQVVVVHGDTHTNRIDQPLRDHSGRRLTNFQRVETFGSPFMGWTTGIIDSESPTPIRFETHPWPARYE